MNNRIQISQDSAALPCENCGYPTVRVARLVGGDGAVLGQTLVCTSCRSSRHRAADQAEQEHPGAVS